MMNRCVIGWRLALLVFVAALAPMAHYAHGEEEREVDLAERCEREVIELHQFFRDWVNADIENTDEVFERFSGVMAPGFHIVSPDSSVLDRATILSIVRDGYSGATGGGTMRIWIEHFEVRAVVGDVAVVSYEEWQEIAGQPKGRISSGVLRARAGTPNGVEWLHLHETWLVEE